MEQPEVEFYPGPSGGVRALHQGFVYYLDRSAESGRKYWRCPTKLCKGRLSTLGDKVQHIRAHNHSPKHGAGSTAKTRMPVLIQPEADVDPPEEETVVKHESTSVSLPRDASILNVVRSTASSLSDAIRLAPSTSWPEVIDILQQTLNEISEFVSDGRVSHVDIVPMHKKNHDDQLMTLRDLVVNDLLDQRATLSSVIRPCRVIADRISVTDIGTPEPNTSYNQGYRVDDDMLTEIKEEKDDSYEDIGGDEKADKVNTNHKSLSNNVGHTSEKAGTDSLDPLWTSDNEDEDTDNDANWIPSSGRKRDEERMKKTPKKCIAGKKVSRSYAKGNEWVDNYTKGNRFQFLQKYERYEVDSPFEASTNTECFFCEPDSRYKSKSLSDFLQHLEDAEHIDKSKRGYRMLDCPVCDGVIRNRILQRGGSLTHQTLRLVGRVTQHMWNKHGFKPDKNFIPVYECNQCPKKLYSDIEFVDHKRTAHKNLRSDQQTTDERLPESQNHDDMNGEDVEDFPVDRPAKYENYGHFPYDNTRPSFGLPNSDYDSALIIVKQTDSYDLGATFKAGTSSTCPFCVDDPKHKCTSLKDLLDHMKNVEHLFSRENESSFCLKCPQCTEVQTCFEKEGVKEEILLLQLLGQIVHHMAEEHSFKPDKGFLPSFECKGCSYLFYSEERYQNHVVKEHMYDTNRLGPHHTGEYGPARPYKPIQFLPNSVESIQNKIKRNNRMVLIQRFESFDMDERFEAGINTTCPFCPTDSLFRATSLTDFIKHMTEGEHVDFSVGGYRKLNCPESECSESVRNRVLSRGGSTEKQVLRLVGKAIQHMIQVHNYVPEPGFLRPYTCPLCSKQIYADQDFLEHLRVAHRTYRWDKESAEPELTNEERTSPKSGESGYDIDKDMIPMRGKFRNRFVIAEKFEKYNVDEDFSEAVNRKCPMCPSGQEFLVKNLRDVISHFEEAKHLTIRKYGLRCIKCPMCNKEIRNRIGSIDGANDTQIIRLLGKMLQHMLDQHEHDATNTFLPRYKCNKCHFQSFDCSIFLDHLTRSHMPKLKKSGFSQGEANLPSTVALNSVKVPEAELDFDVSFPDAALCMFCDKESAATVHTLGEFLAHMEAAGHLTTVEDESECSVLCPQCTQDFCGPVSVKEEQKKPQLLNIINRAIQHLHSEHKFKFSGTFPRRFNCEHCSFSSYSGLDLNIHAQQTHATQQSLDLSFSENSGDDNQEDDVEEDESIDSSLDLRNPIDMCKPQLTEALFEGKWEPLLSLTLPLRKSLEPKCPLCTEKDIPFRTLTELVEHWKSEGHVKRSNDIWEMPCSQCEDSPIKSDHHESEGETANILSVLGKWTVHRMETHEWSPPTFFPNYQCTICQYSNYNPRECKHHMKTCIQKQPESSKLKCPVCKDMTSVKLYRRHVKRCTKKAQNEKQQCSVCKNMISTRHFRGHVRMCSKPKEQYKRSPCPICGKMLLDEMHYHKSNLRKHIMICHTDVFPHLCSVCSMQFKRRNDLNRHMFQKHDLNISQQTPKYCDLCDYKTLSKTHISRHMTTHRTTAEVTCDKCGKQYKSVYHLNVHLRSAHRRKEPTNTMFRCTQCSYTTPVRGYFTKHLRYHRDMKSGAGHWCTICNYNARFPVVLKNHMKNVHKVDITKPSATSSTLFKSSRSGRKYKNMRLPGELNTREVPEPIVPTEGKMVRTRKRGRVARAEKDLVLEEEEGKRSKELRTGDNVVEEGVEVDALGQTASGTLERLRSEEEEQDYHSQGSGSIAAGLPGVGLGLGDMAVEGMGGMMNPGVSLTQPPNQGVGEGDMTYAIPPGGYPFNYNLSNMYY